MLWDPVSLYRFGKTSNIASCNNGTLSRKESYAPVQEEYRLPTRRPSLRVMEPDSLMVSGRVHEVVRESNIIQDLCAAVCVWVAGLYRSKALGSFLHQAVGRDKVVDGILGPL